jgi:quercetin dioxygenase-like cupin family protein
MDRTPVPEAKLVDTEVGKKPEGDGWFVVNVGDAVAMGMYDDLYGVVFEGEFGAFPHFGINVRVLGPGRQAAMYHAESGQEAFLVLQGEAVLIVEDEERPLRQWDFVHCPPETRHMIVGAGDGPCVVLMTGSPRTSDVRYVPSEVAHGRGAAVKLESTSPESTLGAFPRWRRTRPDTWRELPWGR